MIVKELIKLSVWPKSSKTINSSFKAMENIFWMGYSNEERHSSISTLENVVSKYGDIVDFKFFSDISLTMVIEIEEYKIDKLYNELATIIKIDKFKILNSNSKIERKVYLNITFSKGTGNLTTEIPNVPG